MPESLINAGWVGRSSEYSQTEGLHKETPDLGEETACRELQQGRHVVNVFP